MVSAAAAAGAVLAAEPATGDADGTPAQKDGKADDPAVAELDDVSRGAQASYEAIRAEAVDTGLSLPAVRDTLASWDPPCPPPPPSHSVLGRGWR